MGWLDYYHLLEKYNGDLKKASTKELSQAAKNNPNDPFNARRLAEKKWQEKKANSGSDLTQSQLDASDDVSEHYGNRE
jgi:hypothetical protein